MSWTPDHPGGVIQCDAPGCTRTRRAYCLPAERETWVAFQAGNHVCDFCPVHSSAMESTPRWLTRERKANR